MQLISQKDWFEFKEIGTDKIPIIQARAYNLLEKISKYVPSTLMGMIVTSRTHAIYTGDETDFLKVCSKVEQIMWPEKF